MVEKWDPVPGPLGSRDLWDPSPGPLGPSEPPETPRDPRDTWDPLGPLRSFLIPGTLRNPLRPENLTGTTLGPPVFLGM